MAEAAAEEKKEEPKLESCRGWKNPEKFPVIKSEHSLVKKYLTEDIWNKCKDTVTKTAGFTLYKCISCSVVFDNQHVGIYAGDEDCYTDFSAVFDPLIKEYHNFDGAHKADLNVDNIKGNIKEECPVKSTRIRVGRNIAGYGLSPGITKEQRVEVEKLMKAAFDTFEGELKGTYYPLYDMKEEDRKSLVDKHFLFVSGDPNLIVGGMEDDWPQNRGIFINKDETFLVWINEEDQLRIISMRKGGDVKAVFSLLMKGLNTIEAYLKKQGKEFKKSDKLGYITSCPSNLGTGMRASVHMDLPNLKKKLGSDGLKSHCKEMKLQARGTRGESGGDTGVTYDISNRHRLGYTEVELVQTMIDGVNKLYEEDQAAAKEEK
eukprot:CAMPEP_0201567878 /NCGR_PEP_ID=MMETSP0190_2-20130828/8596_1 /ASSEMBLY_ACC=CAM_ASM_000263 /TAXON_ID=37353 /ORGANISM="Rosalina sp." /LENGTH=374 /DNA_ID=CAMNT_0047988365 /DNA_START=93 /DNA_END=1217 /DNA_ORIENTATION=-